MKMIFGFHGNTSVFTGFPLQAVMLSSLFTPTTRVVPAYDTYCDGEHE